VVIPTDKMNAVSRGNERKRKRLTAPEPRPQSIRSHWRADGAPKTAYRTHGEALAVADERRQDSGAELNVYRCDFCSAWHMGNPQDRDA
jgi:hypothetical protein